MADKRKHLKQKGKSRRVGMGAQSERVEVKLEGKSLPFSWFFFVVFLRVLFSLYLKRRR